MSRPSFIVQTHVGKDGAISALLVDTSRAEDLGGNVIVAAVPAAQADDLYDALGAWLNQETVVAQVGAVTLVRRNRGTWGVRNGDEVVLYLRSDEATARAEYARLVGEYAGDQS